jgi:hypothetical protein
MMRMNTQLTLDLTPTQGRPTHSYTVYDRVESLHRIIAAEDKHGPTESPLHRMPRRRRGRTTV